MSRPVIDGQPQRKKKPEPMEPLRFRDIQPYPSVPQPDVFEMPQEWTPEQFQDTQIEGEI